MPAKRLIQGVCLFLPTGGAEKKIPQLLQLHNIADSHSKSGFVKFENPIFSHTVIPQNFKMIL